MRRRKSKTINIDFTFLYFFNAKVGVLNVQRCKSTAKKFIFDCDKCNNEFESKLSHITDGSWCPNCRYKTEEKLTKILKEIYPEIKTQAKFDWCKNIKNLPFDFCLEEQKIILECDGENHWIQVSKWKTPEHNKARDLYKMKCANEMR